MPSLIIVQVGMGQATDTVATKPNARGPTVILDTVFSGTGLHEREMEEHLDVEATRGANSTIASISRLN